MSQTDLSPLPEPSGMPPKVRCVCGARRWGAGLDGRSTVCLSCAKWYARADTEPVDLFADGKGATDVGK